MTNPIPQDEFPEEPDHDNDLVRYGFARQSDISPSRMYDGYWTPWHIATDRIRALEKRIDFHKSVLNVQTGFFNAAIDRLERAEVALQAAIAEQMKDDA